MNPEANTSPNFHPEFAGTFDQMSVGQSLPYLTYLEIALTRIRKNTDLTKSTKKCQSFWWGVMFHLKLRSGNICREFPQ